MKINFISSIMMLCLLFACGTTKKTTKVNDMANAKPVAPIANLIDGDWEADYIMNTPKPFADIFPDHKPNITFNTANNTVTGNTGCNNFNGNITIDKNKISFGENLATTRRACADMTGETLFLETLKKVNSYSVTNTGKTLNLIIGDIAVMRLNRK